MSVIVIIGCDDEEKRIQMVAKIISMVNKTDSDNEESKDDRVKRFYVEIEDAKGNTIRGIYKSSCRPIVGESINIKELPLARGDMFIHGKLQKIL